MATGTINFYSNLKKWLQDGTVDLDTDTINIALLNEGYTPVHTHSTSAQLSNEVAAGGYAQKPLASVTIAATASAFVFDAADLVWTASGAAFTAYHWVMVDKTASDALLAWGFYGHRLNLYRKTVPNEGFNILHRWAQRMPAGWFVGQASRHYSLGPRVS